MSATLEYVERALDAAQQYVAPRGRRPTQDELTSRSGISRQSLSRAVRILRSGGEALQHAVRDGTVSLSAGAELAALPHGEQDAAIAQVRDAGVYHSRPVVSPAGSDLVGEQILHHLSNQFDTLATVMAGVGALDPAIGPDEAARWIRRLGHKSIGYRQVIKLLKERSRDAEELQHHSD